jgi:hypothetical protein
LAPTLDLYRSTLFLYSGIPVLYYFLNRSPYFSNRTKVQSVQVLISLFFLFNPLLTSLKHWLSN